MSSPTASSPPAVPQPHPKAESASPSDPRPKPAMIITKLPVRTSTPCLVKSLPLNAVSPRIEAEGNATGSSDDDKGLATKKLSQSSTVDETYLRERTVSISSDVGSPVSKKTSGASSVSRASTLSPTFQRLAHPVRCLARMQVLAEKGVKGIAPARIASMVREITKTLASEESYRNAVVDTFNWLKAKYDDNSQIEDSEERSIATGKLAVMCNETLNKNINISKFEGYGLPLKRLPKVMARWYIPNAHLPLFWAQIRKHCLETDTSVMPEHILFQEFEIILAKVLRRVRDRHANRFQVSRGQFVTHNKNKLEDEYDMGELIGTGSFGKCLHVVQKNTKAKFVCKLIAKESAGIPEEEIHCELELMKQLDHPNVLRVFQWFETEASFALILEPANGGDMRKLLSQAKQAGLLGVHEKCVATVSKQLLEALTYIHERGGIFHRDVKPANVLLAHQVSPKASTAPELAGVRALLADFGVAELCGEVHSGFKGTLGYLAPEVFAEHGGTKSDIWAVGVTIFELLCAKRPYSGEGAMGLYANLRRKELDVTLVVDAGASVLAVETIQKMLIKEPDQRPAAREVLQFPWFEEQHTQTFDLKNEKRKLRNGLRDYQSNNFFSKTVFNCVAAHLQTAQVEKLSNIFKEMDVNNDGVLSQAEMESGLSDVGVDSNLITMLFDSVDVDKDGSVKYTEFLAGLLSMTSVLTNEVILQAFHIFDKDASGYVSIDELHEVLDDGGSVNSDILPDGMTYEDVLKQIDVSGDGLVSQEEFCNFVRNQPRLSTTPPARRPQRSVCLSTYSYTGAESEVTQTPLSTPRKITKSVDWDQNVDKSPNDVSELQSPPKAGEEDNRCIFTILSSIGETLQKQSEQPTRNAVCKSWTNNDFGTLCEGFAKRLAQEHWLFTMGDLRELEKSDWVTLNLPLKIQAMLRNRLQRD